DRAREVIAQVRWVAVEDTRVSRKLLEPFGLQPNLISLHEHNERHQVRTLVDRLQSGESGALISDAGTPLVSDPGYRLVGAVHDAGIRIEVIPGPSAVTAALSVSGLPTDRFQFVGFPPMKGRHRWLAELSEIPHTLLMFEAPHRIQKLLSELVAVMGPDRPASICRELTKAFEQTVKGTLGSLNQALESGDIPCKGEFVVVVGGVPKEEAKNPQVGHLINALKDQVTPSLLADAIASSFGLRKKVVYNQILDAKHQDSA
ncbi:MAG: 16S rRNA (cytidine(1402)-2'-O)-methyltransferase, partial [Gammaproteobacteria bacterium]